LRILVTIPHYFGSSPPDFKQPGYASYIEPIGKIAALNETIVALLGNFGPNRCTYFGETINTDRAAPPRRVDIVIMTMRDHNILPLLGLAPETFEIEYVTGEAPWIPFHAQSLLRDRLGSYDFYCYLEDDMIIHDPAFFEKLLWFQNNFGHKCLLAPVRYELASTGTPAKVIIDFDLRPDLLEPFRRANQKYELEGAWNGRRHAFQLPGNPHAGSYFLTQEQMAHWVRQSSFNDHDASWVGPIESANTLSVGKVFDIYKAVRPDPFFLEVQHFGVRYSVQSAPPGTRRGEPPLLAIAQNALRSAIKPDGAAARANGDTGESFAHLVEKWIAQGTALEHRSEVDALKMRLGALTTELERRNLGPGVGFNIGGPTPAPTSARRAHDAKSMSKVGRNEPCPCGSGKKFKHCHGRTA
jgi:hypothetical protein